MKHTPLYLLLPLICLILSCAKKDDRGKGDCPTDLMCTMEYRTITISVTDTNGAPVALDEYRTVRLSDNREFDLRHDAGNWEDSGRRATGIYPVLTDSQQKEASTAGELFEFRGEKDNKVLVREQFRIRDNCCHVELLSGNTTVVAGSR